VSGSYSRIGIARWIGYFYSPLYKYDDLVLTSAQELPLG
jgi:hypothetical protein